MNSCHSIFRNHDNTLKIIGKRFSLGMRTIMGLLPLPYCQDTHKPRLYAKIFTHILVCTRNFMLHKNGCAIRQMQITHIPNGHTLIIKDL